MFLGVTTDTLEQAIHRAGSKSGNKGADAALAALEMADLLPRLDTPAPGAPEGGRRKGGRTGPKGR